MAINATRVNMFAHPHYSAAVSCLPVCQPQFTVNVSTKQYKTRTSRRVSRRVSHATPNARAFPTPSCRDIDTLLATAFANNGGHKAAIVLTVNNAQL